MQTDQITMAVFFWYPKKEEEKRKKLVLLSSLQLNFVVKCTFLSFFLKLIYDIARGSHARRLTLFDSNDGG